MQRVTIKDIARMAHVSVTTVSRALNGSLDINEETRRRILKICRREGYRTNLLAKSLISSRTNVLGVIQPDISSPFHAVLALHIETCARRLGYQVMLCRGKPSDENIDELFDFLLGQHVDGILLCSSSNRAYDVLGKYQSMVPSVLLGACPPENSSIRLNSISTDNYAGGMLAAEYLFGLGHRKIVYLGMREGSITHERRHQGFVDAAEKLGMQVRTIYNNDTSSTIEGGHRLSAALLKQGISETAVFAASDLLALGFMQAADEAGISIPEQISLLGYDNIEYAALDQMRLTTFSQRPEVLARHAVQLLLDLIEKQESYACTFRMLTPCLVERDSCRSLT